MMHYAPAKRYECPYCFSSFVDSPSVNNSVLLLKLQEEAENTKMLFTGEDAQNIVNSIWEKRNLYRLKEGASCPVCRNSRKGIVEIPEYEVVCNLEKRRHIIYPRNAPVLVLVKGSNKFKRISYGDYCNLSDIEKRERYGYPFVEHCMGKFPDSLYITPEEEKKADEKWRKKNENNKV